MNCPPAGICENSDHDPQRPKEGPGTAGPLRGRKRDIFEGGHRVPGIISFPSELNGQGDNLVSWEMVTTMDFLPTVMDVLGVDRPIDQQSWAMDGRSVLPLLRNATGFRWADSEEGHRSLGLMYHDANLAIQRGYGYRYGKWKYTEGSVSCSDGSDCRKPMLFDLETDLGERHDISSKHPEILRDLQNRFLQWHRSVMYSRREESKCKNAEELALPDSISMARIE